MNQKIVPLSSSKQNSVKLPFLFNLMFISPSDWNVTPQRKPVEQFCHRKEKTDSGTLSRSCPNPSLKQNATMTFMTGNYWRSSKLWKNGNITSKAHPIPLG